MMSSPVPPGSTGSPVGVDDGEVPAVEGEPDADRSVAGQQRAAGDDRRLGRAVGVPHLAAVADEPRRELGRAGLAAEDEQPDLVEGVGRPQRRQGRDGRDDRDAAARPATGRGPCRVRTSDARRRHQAGAVPPGQPHLLAATRRTPPRGRPAPGRRGRSGRRRRNSGPRRRRRRRRAVGDGDALGYAGRARGEDDPGVVVERRAAPRSAPPAAGGGDREPVVQHDAHAGLAEDELGPLLGVVGVDGHVGGAGVEHAEDGDVEVVGARGHADADAVAGPDAGGPQAGRPASRRRRRGRGRSARVRRRRARARRGTWRRSCRRRRRGCAAGGASGPRSIGSSCVNGASNLEVRTGGPSEQLRTEVATGWMARERTPNRPRVRSPA